MSEDTPSRDDVDVYERLLDDASTTREFDLETEHGTITVEATKVGRATRNRVQSQLPGGFFELGEEADLDAEAADVEDLDLEDVSLADLMLDEAATEAWAEMILESIRHPSLGDSELRDLVENHLSDQDFMGLGSEILEWSAGGATDGFRAR